MKGLMKPRGLIYPPSIIARGMQATMALRTPGATGYRFGQPTSSAVTNLPANWITGLNGSLYIDNNGFAGTLSQLYIPAPYTLYLWGQSALSVNVQDCWFQPGSSLIVGLKNGNAGVAGGNLTKPTIQRNLFDNAGMYIADGGFTWSFNRCANLWGGNYISTGDFTLGIDADHNYYTGGGLFFPDFTHSENVHIQGSGTYNGTSNLYDLSDNGGPSVGIRSTGGWTSFQTFQQQSSSALDQVIHLNGEILLGLPQLNSPVQRMFYPFTVNGNAGTGGFCRITFTNVGIDTPITSGNVNNGGNNVQIIDGGGNFRISDGASLTFP